MYIMRRRYGDKFSIVPDKDLDNLIQGVSMLMYFCDKCVEDDSLDPYKMNALRLKGTIKPCIEKLKVEK